MRRHTNRGTPWCGVAKTGRLWSALLCLTAVGYGVMAPCATAADRDVDPTADEELPAEEVRKYGVHGRPNVPDGSGETGVHRRPEVPPLPENTVGTTRTRPSANERTGKASAERGAGGATGAVIDRQDFRSWRPN